VASCCYIKIFLDQDRTKDLLHNRQLDNLWNLFFWRSSIIEIANLLIFLLFIKVDFW